MGQFQVQMPDGTVKSVQGTTLAAAINNAGAGATAPGSGGGGGGSVTVQSAPSGGGGGGGGSAPSGTFQTKNGQQTVQTMAQQLKAVGWGGDPSNAAAVVAAYASTTGAPVTPGPASPSIQGSPGTSAPPSSDAATAKLGQIANQMTQALAAGNQAAFDEAVREYNLNFGLDTDKFNESKRQFDATQAQNVGALTGVYNGQPTLAAQTAQQSAANQYLTLIAGLRGPNDPVAYLRTLQGTPQGLKDIVNAAAGRYQLGGAPSGEQAAPATVGGQIANMNNAGGGANPLDPLAQALPPANQIDSRAYNAMLPSQKAGLWSIYEYGGPSGAMRPEDAQVMYANSLPKYGGPATGAVKF